MTSPALQAFENKDVAVRAWPGAAPHRGLKRHQLDSSMFSQTIIHVRCNVKKLMRNFPCLTFQIFRIRIDAQVDDG